MGERVFDLTMAIPNGGFLSWLVHHEAVALGATLPADESLRPRLTAFPFVIAAPAVLSQSNITYHVPVFFLFEIKYHFLQI
jgi:hypothetical protein